jgi:hypothetical protein
MQYRSAGGQTVETTLDLVALDELADCQPVRADPPAGMRVVVAGRPDPQVPDDVQGWHPLRDAQTIWPARWRWLAP